MTGEAQEGKNHPRFHSDALMGTAIYLSPIFLIKIAADISFLSQLGSTSWAMKGTC